MLATKISFMNEIANIAERAGAYVEAVRRGIGSDSRIGFAFIYPGVGCGDPCFPKDVQALERTARKPATIRESCRRDSATTLSAADLAWCADPFYRFFPGRASTFRPGKCSSGPFPRPSRHAAPASNAFLV